MDYVPSLWLLSIVGLNYGVLLTVMGEKEKQRERKQRVIEIHGETTR